VSASSIPRTQRVACLIGPEAVEVRVVDVPVPKADEVLVRIGAATTCGTDVKVFLRGGHPRMLRPPCPFGHEMAGTVELCGGEVDAWRVGDRVTVANSAACGACEYCKSDRENLCVDLQYLNGAFGELILLPARFVARSLYGIADDLELEIASLAEPLACVVHGVNSCEIRRPSSVVVYGAGPIGLLFVGVLASRGHGVVVADPNPPRLDVARQLGAVDAIPIRRGGGQFRDVVAASPDGKGFDVAIDASGVPEGWSDVLRSVRAGGLVSLFGGCAPGTTVPLDTHAVHYGEITVKGVYHHRPATFREALDLLSGRAFDARLLLSAERELVDIEAALRSMIRRESLKVVIRTSGGETP